MSDDLRAKVEALLSPPSPVLNPKSNTGVPRCVVCERYLEPARPHPADRCEAAAVLALIPADAVLVTRAALNAIATESIPRGTSVQAYRKAVLRRLDESATPPTDT